MLRFSYTEVLPAFMQPTTSTLWISPFHHHPQPNNMNTITKEQLIEVYQLWCKKTGRNGSVMIGKSVHEFLDYVVPVINEGRQERSDLAPDKERDETHSIVTDEELNIAWGNARFGDISKRDVIATTLKKVAQAWGTGHTAMCIVRELGLVEYRNGQQGLSDKGLRYLLALKSDKEREVAVGFAEWIDDRMWMLQENRKWSSGIPGANNLTTDELFTEYLKSKQHG